MLLKDFISKRRVNTNLAAKSPLIGVHNETLVEFDFVEILLSELSSN